MMSNIRKLVIGELKRLLKYKILVIGIIVSILWVLIIALANREDIEPFVSILLGMDASIMSILLLGAAYYFEKQEGTIKTMLVAPIGLLEVLVSKIVSAIIMSIISAFLVALSARIFQGIEINLLLLFIYTVVILLSHAAIAYTICLFSKDFGAMMGYLGSFMIISIVPMVLNIFDLIPKDYEYIFLIIPFKAADTLYSSLINDISIKYIIISLLYLIVLGSLLYKFVVYKRFRKFAIEG
ncbi:MAG: ABC transporter permease [Bacilli bacterium]